MPNHTARTDGPGADSASHRGARRRRHRRWGGALATPSIVLVGALSLVACGGDDNAAEGDAAGEETFAITGVDFAFEGVPVSMPAGSKLTFTNASDAEAHQLVVLRIPEDEPRSVDALVALPQDELFAVFAEEQPPAAVLFAKPGEDGFAAFGDGTIDEPGRYALLCFVPVGADPDEYLAAAQESQEPVPDVAGGPPHAAEGMFAEISVQ
jgi:hypothetical protein